MAPAGPDKRKKEYLVLANCVKGCLSLDTTDLTFQAQLDVTNFNFNFDYGAWQAHQHLNILPKGSLQCVVWAFKSSEDAALVMGQHAARLLEVGTGIRQVEIEQFLAVCDEAVRPLAEELRTRSQSLLIGRSSSRVQLPNHEGAPVSFLVLISQTGGAIVKLFAHVADDKAAARRLVLEAALAVQSRHLRFMQPGGAWQPPIAARIARLLPMSAEVHATAGEFSTRGSADYSGAALGAVRHEQAMADAMGRSTCVGCGKVPPAAHPGAHLLCGRCQKVCYCSRECQQSHWRTHKPACLPPA